MAVKRLPKISLIICHLEKVIEASSRRNGDDASDSSLDIIGLSGAPETTIKFYITNRLFTSN